MKKTMIVIFVVGCAIASPLFAQVSEQTILTYEVIQSERKNLVAGAMELSRKESELFWPVYEEYRKAMAVPHEEWLKLVKNYMAHQGSLADNKAKNMMARLFEVERAELAIKEKYAGRFNTFIPARKVMRFFQIERKLDNVVYSELAKDLPLAR